MKKKEQGILTVEASIVLTLCVLFMLFLFSFARVYNAQSLVSHAILQSSDSVALESFLREETLTGSEADVTELANRFMETTSISADNYTSLRSANVPEIAKEKFIYALGRNETEADDKLKKLGVKDGLAGVDFSGSYIELGSDNVVVYATYTIEMQFGVFGMNEITVSKAAKSKTFGDILFGIEVIPESPIKGSASGGGNYKHGERVQISATPNYGYKFQKWADGSTENPRVVTVDGAKTYVAMFEQSEFGVNLEASPAVGGSVAGGGLYKYLDHATITATPATGYHFTRWSIYGHNDNTTKSANNLTASLNIDQTYTCIANFEKNNYTVNVETSGTTSVQAYILYSENNTSSITVPYQTPFLLVAPDVEGYRFIGWREKGTNDYFSIAATTSMAVPAGNITYEACYESTLKTVRFYNRDGSLYAERQVYEGNSLGGDMPANPKDIGWIFGGWNNGFNRDTKVYNDMAVYGSWATCTRHSVGDCGVVHSIRPTRLDSHKSPGKTYECMCIVCADCGCYLTYRNNRWVKTNGVNWSTGKGSTIYISPSIWCIKHQWGDCEGYKNSHSAGTYYVH